MDKPRVSEVPDSEEFTHLGRRDGSVEVYVHPGYIELSHEENDFKVSQAYLDLGGAQQFQDELTEAIRQLAVQE